ncbi:MAG: hypothetical protein ACPGU3_06615 [Litorivicinus sp.]
MYKSLISAIVLGSVGVVAYANLGAPVVTTSSVGSGGTYQQVPQGTPPQFDPNDISRLNGCGLLGSSQPYVVNVSETYNLQQCLTPQSGPTYNGPTPSFVTSNCGQGLSDNGQFTPQATIASCRLDARVVQSDGSVQTLGSLDVEIRPALAAQTITADTTSTPLPTTTSPLYDGATYTIPVSGATSGVTATTSTPQFCTVVVNGNNVEVTAAITGSGSGPFGCLVNIVAPRDPLATTPVGESNTIPATIQVSGLQAQPSNVEIAGVNGSTIYAGGSYPLNVANQQGSGAVTWSVSDSSACTVTSDGTVLAGSTAGTCEVTASIEATSTHASASVGPMSIPVVEPRELDLTTSNDIDIQLRNGANYSSLYAESGWPALYTGDGNRSIYFLAPSDYTGQMSVSADSCGLVYGVTDRFTPSSGELTLRRHPSNSNASNRRLLFMRMNTISSARDCELTFEMGADLTNGYAARSIPITIPILPSLGRTNIDGTAFIDNKPTSNNCVAGVANATTDSLMINGGVPPFRIARQLLYQTSLLSSTTGYVPDLGGSLQTATYSTDCAQMGIVGGNCRGTLSSGLHYGESMAATVTGTLSGRRLDVVAYWDEAPRPNGGVTTGGSNPGATIPADIGAWVQVADANNRKISARVNLSCDTVNTSGGQEFEMALNAEALNSSLTYEIPWSAFTTTAGGAIDISLRTLTPAICAVSGRTVTAGANGICRIEATNAGFTVGGNVYSSATVTGNIVVNNPSTSLAWTDGTDTWSACTALHGPIDGTGRYSNAETVDCPTGKEWVPTAFIEAGSCDGTETWSNAQALSLGALHANDGFWTNGVSDGEQIVFSSLSALDANFVRQVRQNGRYLRSNFRDALGSGSVEVKVCGARNAPVASAASSTAGLAPGATLSATRAVSASENQDAIVWTGSTLSYATDGTTVTNTSDLVLAVADEGQASNISARMSVTDLLTLIGRSGTGTNTGQGYDADGLLDSSGREIRVSFSASDNVGHRVIGVGARTGSYNHGILQIKPVSGSPQATGANQAIYLVR